MCIYVCVGGGGEGGCEKHHNFTKSTCLAANDSAVQIIFTEQNLGTQTGEQTSIDRQCDSSIPLNRTLLHGDIHRTCNSKLILIFCTSFSLETYEVIWLQPRCDRMQLCLVGRWFSTSTCVVPLKIFTLNLNSLF